MAGWVRSAAYKAAGRIIAEARIRQGLTQRELAARLGVGPSTVAKVELNQRKIDLVELVAIARALNIPAHDLAREVIDALPDVIDL